MSFGYFNPKTIFTLIIPIFGVKNYQKNI
ncbi:hypothetical protein LCGC14_2773620, partial [marine sediment metagenome]